MNGKQDVALTRNLILARVSPATLEMLSRQSRIEEYQLNQTIFGETERSDVFFPLDAVISLLRHLRDGSSVEVGMVGADGMAGFHTILDVDRTPYLGLIQGRGLIARMSPDVLRVAMQQDAQFRQLLHRYVYWFLSQTSQVAACNRMHVVEERLANWILHLHDRTGTTGNEISVTQEFLSRMLAARRAGINVAIRSLTEAGAIEHQRNRIRVVDRRRLEELACECYETNVEEYRRTMGFPPSLKDRVSPID